MAQRLLFASKCH